MIKAYAAGLMVLVLMSSSALIAGSVRASTPHAEPAASIWSVDAISVKPGMLSFARRYFEQGWLPARYEAIARGYIKSFRILIAPQESDTQPEVILMTEYGDEASFAARETHFAEVFAALGQPDTILIDGKDRADIFGARQGSEDYRDITEPSAPRIPSDSLSAPGR